MRDIRKEVKDSGIVPGGTMSRHLLINPDVRNAKPKEKPYRLNDGDGLFLYVPPSGVRAWQFRYKIEGQARRR